MQKRVTPQRYHIVITPDLNDFTFAGQMTLNAHAHEPAEAIHLDSLELDIRQCRVKPEGKTRPEGKCRFTLDSAESSLTVHFPGPITGDFELVIDYTGKNKRQHGRFLPAAASRSRGHRTIWPSPSSRKATPGEPSPASTTSRKRPSLPWKW